MLPHIFLDGDCTPEEAEVFRKQAPSGAISDELWMKYENKNDQTGELIKNSDKIEYFMKFFINFQIIQENQQPF